MVASSLLFFALDAPGWFGVGIALVLLAVAALLVWYWSGRAAWGAPHRLTYAWIGFTMEPLDEEPGTIDLIGNAVFAAGAIVLLAVAARTVQRASAQAGTPYP